LGAGCSSLILMGRGSDEAFLGQWIGGFFDDYLGGAGVVVVVVVVVVALPVMAKLVDGIGSVLFHILNAGEIGLG